MRAVHPLWTLVPLLIACGGQPESVTSAVRDTLPSGVERVRYASLDTATVVHPDLRLGSLAGDPNVAFGDVRGIEAGPDGTIYVLDRQASEIRAFAEDGTYLKTLTTRGEGPGELSEANGMVLRDGVLWIQDHAKWQNVGVDLAGEEVGRVPMHVRSYSYFWNGTVDERGRFWKPASHSDEEQVFPPPEGLSEGEMRRYLKVYDPATDGTDSVHVANVGWRTFVSRNARGGYSHWRVPFDPEVLTAVDPAGGFWQVATEEYRVARMDAGGDTVLVIEVAVEPSVVTDADRAAWHAELVERAPDQRRAADAVRDLIPETPPAIASLDVDDRGRVWVGRPVADGATRAYDIFDRNGGYHGSVRLAFEPLLQFPLRIRDGRLYTLMLDSLDVGYVMRVPLPEQTGVR